MVIIRNENDKVLILKRSEVCGTYVHFWSFPGGSIDPGETREEAGSREIMEETTLTVDESSLQPVGVFEGNKITVYYFLTTEFEGSVSLNEESDAYMWVTLEDIYDLKFIPTQKEIYEKIF